MANENEELDEGEELDVTPEDDTPAGGGAATDRPGKDDDDRGTSSRSDRADRQPVNRWRGVQSSIGDTLGKGIKGAESDHQLEEGEDNDDDLKDDDDEDLEGGEDGSDRRAGAEGADGEEPEPQGEEGKKAGAAEGDDDDEVEDRYEVVDTKTGDVYKIDLPEGGVIRLKADGEVVELNSVDELVANAQKGLAFDRVTSMAGQENATLRRQISDFEAAEKEDSDLLLKLIYGELSDEELEKLQKELEPYRDPKAREGLQALAREESRKKTDEAATERQQREAVSKFWENTAKIAKADLSKFEYLDAEDLNEIQTRFHGVYLAEREKLIPQYKAQAIDQKRPEAEAIAAADRDARKILTEKTLRRVMRDLNAKYQKRAGKGGDGKAEERGKREATAHNNRVDAKMRQRRDPRHRSLRGGGSAPRDRTDMNRRGNEAVTFDQKIRRGLARLRQAGREAGSGSEE